MRATLSTKSAKFFGLALGLFLAGCQTGHIPNPNDPADVGPLPGKTVRKNLQSITDALFQRRVKDEIDEKTYQALVSKAAAEMVGSVDVGAINPSDAWQYGVMLRDARNWKGAEAFLKVAVDNARKTKNEDRRINDSLQLARVYCEEGRVEEGIKLARSTFNASAKDAAPILFGVYLEIVPASQGKGHDLELAQLVEDAIQMNEKVQVDPNSDAGKRFIVARPMHEGRAWHVVADLYGRAGKPDLAKKAEQKADALRDRSLRRPA